MPPANPGLDALELFCESRQLIVNTEKSKYMLVTKKRRHDQPVMVYKNKHLQSVENFTYLGVNFARNNSFTKGLKERSQQIYQSQSVLDLHTLRHPSASASHIFELFDYLLSQNCCMVLKYGVMEAANLWNYITHAL